MGKLRDFVSFVVRPWRAIADGGERGWVNILSAFGWFNDDSIDDKSALATGTYYNCIRNIADDTAKIPFRLIKNEGRKRVPLNDDPLVRIFAIQFNPKMTAFTGRSTLMHWAAGWGRAFAERVYNPRGQLAELWPIHPSRVTREKDGSFKVHNNDGSATPIPAARMFHYYGLSGDGYDGYSVMKLMSNTLQTTSAIQRFAKNFWRTGTRLSGTLETDNTLKPEARNNLRESWATLYEGPENAGKTALLEAGVKFKNTTMPLGDAQMIELLDFEEREIAAWFRMPLYKLQNIARAQGWSTLDSQETDYVSSCLMPWIVRLEQEICRQLMTPEQLKANIYPHFEFKGLLRGDLKTRKEYYQTMRTIGVMTGNEIRTLEDMDASDDPLMDVVFIQGAMVPLDKAGTQPTQAAPVDTTPDDNTTDPNKGTNNG